MTTRKTDRRATSLLVGGAGAALAALAWTGARAGAQDEGGFGAHLGAFAAALQAAGEPGLAALEAWTPEEPPGGLADLARRVGALPLGPEAIPRVAALVGRDDPFLQEAGLVVARGQLEQGLVPGWFEACAPAAARAVAAPDVDPWVVLAAVELADSSGDWRAAGAGPAAEALLAALAGAAARGPARPEGLRSGPSASRMRPADVEAYARLDALLGARLGQAGAADAALLAHLERRHGTRGLEATKAAVARREAEARVLHALASGDPRGAAWALERLRALAPADDAARARLEHLAALVGQGPEKAPRGDDEGPRGR